MVDAQCCATPSAVVEKMMLRGIQWEGLRGDLRKVCTANLYVTSAKGCQSHFVVSGGSGCADKISEKETTSYFVEGIQQQFLDGL
jgi:hypothetical protein